MGASTNSTPVSVTVGSGGGGSGYTTRAAAAYYAFDENGGSTVFDQVGTLDATLAGSASWTSLGLQGGWADAGPASFAGNELSAASGDAFTLIWVGRLDTGNRYQALFSMADDAGRDNVMLRYYQPSGYLYLTVNDKSAGLYNAASLLGKIVMISLRCSGGSCSWRVGDAGSWLSASPGTAVASNPRLRVGAGTFGWMPHINNTSAMFWVYGDALTDQEIEANFDFAGSTLNNRGGFTLDGYTP